MPFESHSKFKPRSTWTTEQALALFNLPFNDLLFEAQEIVRHNFKKNTIQVSTLLSIKTGACPEDCSYCPQSIRFNTDIEKHDLLDLDSVKAAASKAKENGATRFCLGASYRGPKDKDLVKIIDMIQYVKSIGLECCATLGLLKPHQADMLSASGLDYYNHNLDTSKANYEKIISTRTYDDRINTLSEVRRSGMKVCCGGIIGMGEGVEDRASLLVELANMDVQPESVPINNLVAVRGTPLEDLSGSDHLDFVKMIAVARILLPKSYVRLSAGRHAFTDEMQALCFFAGANSIFYGDKLLTTTNPDENTDLTLFKKLGLSIEKIQDQSSPNLN
jgi:biotin synthase